MNAIVPVLPHCWRCGAALAEPDRPTWGGARVFLPLASKADVVVDVSCPTCGTGLRVRFWEEQRLGRSLQPVNE